MELGNLASNNTNMQRVRVAASFAIRALETQQWDEGMAAAGRSGQYAIAAKVDLDRFFTATSRLNSALHDMQPSLSGSVVWVREASEQIDVGSRELAQGNDDLSRRTEESAASLQQTAASMEQLTARVCNNADNARHGHALAEDVAHTAQQGNKVVQEVMVKMQEIATSANSIGNMLGVIDGNPCRGPHCLHRRC